MNKNQKFQFIADLLPVVVFFACYKMYGIIAATAGIVVATVLTTIFSYLRNGIVSKMNIFSAVIVSIFGLMTLISNDTIFIKIKPTVINMVFAIIIMFGLIRKKYYLKSILGKNFALKDADWLLLSKRFVTFFVLIAFANEIVWRFFSESTWVWFKAFGVLLLSLVFLAFQMRFIYKNSTSKMQM